MDDRLILVFLTFVSMVLVGSIFAFPGVLGYANERQRIKDEREKNAVAAWQAMLVPLQDQVDFLSMKVSEQALLITQKSDRVDKLEMRVTMLNRDLDTAQRLVTAYLAQLLDNQIVPNPVYIEQTRRTREEKKNEEGE